MSKNIFPKFNSGKYSDKKKTAQSAKNKKTREFNAKFFSAHTGGVAFEILEDETLSDKKYYISEEHTRGALNGDTVVISPFSSNSRDAKVKLISMRSFDKLIGSLHRHEVQKNKNIFPVYYVKPDDSKLKFSVYIDVGTSELKARDGDKVEVKITEYPDDKYVDAIGVITAVFGDCASREANYSAILHSAGIITDFSEEALKIAGSHEHDVLSPENRLDLRDKLIFTIDGSDAKDLDDAISVEKITDGYLLGVHIADVSHYVKENTALDKDAFERGTSIYFADKVIPMLPFTLSNGICSLNSGMDRYALSVFVEVALDGEIKDVKISKSIINSKIRGVYSEINALIEETASEEIKEKYSVIDLGTLKNITQLYAILKKKSIRRGALDLDSAEAKIILDLENQPVDIVKRERGIGELIIEQFMLCANEGVASWLTKKEYPCVYRIHEEPDEDRLSTFIQFSHNLGLKPEYVKKGNNIESVYLQRILNRAKEKGLGKQLSYILLRTMRKARYSDIKKGHFGLGTDCYCHFTSPIRRYPDLSVHRIISYSLSGSEKSMYDSINKRYSSFAKKAADKSSECELRALEAERNIEDLYKTMYMANHIGEIFDATISSVTSFGFFCELDNTCEGLVPLRTLKNSYRYDEDNMALVGREHSYRLGDNVKIKVESADIATQKVDFSIVDEPVSNPLLSHDSKTDFIYKEKIFSERIKPKKNPHKKKPAKKFEKKSGNKN